MNKIQPNHDNFFKDINNPWSKGGDQEVDKVVGELPQGDVLVLGFGVGRHLKCFLDKGYNVTGIEISKIGFDRLENELKSKNQDAELIFQNMFLYDFYKKFHIIFAHMTLQFADNEEKFFEMLKNIKSATHVGGVNYIKLPAQGMTLDFPFKIKDLQTLLSYYSDWEILYSDTEKVNKTDGKVGVYVTVVAKKIQEIVK